MTIVNNGSKVIVEGLSSLDKDFIGSEGLEELGVGDMTRSFTPDEEVPDDFMVIVRMR